MFANDPPLFTHKYHSRVLGAKNVQQVFVWAYALHGNFTGRVTGVCLHDAKAVDAGHLARRLPTTQPGEKPAHLVPQVI